MGTDQSSLDKGLRAAEDKMKGLGTAIMGVGAGVAGLGVAIITPLLGMAKAFADSGSELHDMSTRTGISVEALSALGYAAKQSGADLATVEGGVRKMQKALTSGSEENMKAEETFMSLGLSVQKLMAMNPEQQFATIAKAIAAVPNPTAKAAAAMAIFGKTGTSLIPMIEELPQLTKDAAKLGLVMSTRDANAADALGDAMDGIHGQFSRIIDVVGASLAPMLTDLAGTILKLGKTSIDWINANRPLVVTIFQVGVALVAAGGAITAFGVAVYGVGVVFGGLATAIGVVGTILGTLLSPIGLVTAGLAGLTAWFLTSTTTGRQALTSLGAGFTSLWETATQAFKGIADALRAGDIALAGQILWAGLKVEFTKGINYIKSLWADWGTAAIEVFRGVSFQISGLMVDAWAGIQSGLINAVANMQVAWETFMGFLTKSSNSFAGFFGKVWEKIKALFTGKDIQAELARIDQEVASKNAARDKVTGDRVGGIDAGRARGLGEVEQDRAGSQAALKDQQQAEVDARRKAAQGGLAADAAKLKAAQDELAKLTAQAAPDGLDVFGAAVDEANKGKKKMPGFTPEALDQTMEKAKVSVAGTFSGLSAGGLGAGSNVADDQLKEQKKATDELVKLNKKVEKNRGVFS